MKPWIWTLLTVLLSFAGAQPAVAQSGVAQLKEGQELEEVAETLVVTAQFVPETERGSIYPVKVIPLERIRRQGATTLRELLQHELQVDLEQHSVFGTSLALNGISKENVKVLVDGVPVIGRLNGIIDLDQVSLEGVQRVEIIEGPVSVYYGSDALAGVIHLITDGSARQGLQGETAVDIRSLGEHIEMARAAFGKGRHAVSASFSQRAFDGFDSQPEDRERDWNRREQIQGQLGYKVTLGSHVLRLKSHVFDEELEDLGNLTEGTAEDHLYETRRRSHQLGMRGALNERWSLDWLLGYSDYERLGRTILRDFSSPGQPLDETPEADRTTLDQWLGRGLLTAEGIARDLDLQIGFEGTWDRGTGDRLGAAERTVTDWAAFASLRWQTSVGLVVQPALRSNQNSNYQAPLTPALHLKWDVGTRNTWRGSYSRGFRGPSLKEVFLDFTMAAGPFVYHIIGNEDLRAELGDHYQTTWQFDSGSCGSGHWGLKAEAFYHDVDDLIALSATTADPDVPNRFHRQYININQHRSRGAEVEIAYGLKQWSVEGGIALLSQRNELAEIGSVPTFAESWEAKSQMAYRIENLDLQMSAFYKYRGPRPGFAQSRDGSIRELELREAHQLDVSLNKTLFSGRISLEAGAKNLFDSENLDEVDLASGAAHSRNPVGWGTTYYGRLRWRF